MTVFTVKRLSELGPIITGRTPPGNDSAYYDGDVFFLTPTDMGGSRRIESTERTISPFGAGKLQKCLVPRGVGVSCIGWQMGKSAFITQPTITNQQVNSIILDGTSCDPLFVYYNLSGRRNEIFALGAGGSRTPILNKTDFSKLEIKLPSLSEQHKIASCLGALDDKIELNRRMNETLEEMARALFRDWFVDFGPTRRQMEGRADPAAIMGHAFPPEKATTLAPLFPAKLGENGLPEGWERKAIGEFVDVLETGRRPKGGVKGIDDGVPSVGAESIKRVGVFDSGKTKFVPREFFEAMNSGHIEDGDILIYKDGGKPGELRPAVSYVSCSFPFNEFCINEHVFRLRLDGIPQVTGYCALTTDDAFWQMREFATGVAQPGLNQKAMKSVSIICPPVLELFAKFAEMATPLIDGCNQNAKQNQTLAALRDLLLPKLMSGEIRLKDAEAMV